MQLVAQASGPLEGRLALPGDKSISHRALILGALATGTSRIRGLLEGADVLSTWRALEALGVAVERSAGEVRVHGVGLGGLRAPDDILDLGNSGTGTRLLMGVLAAHGFPALLTGDASLRKRPMRRVTEPLARMGATFTTREGGRLPLCMVSCDRPQPIAYASPVASAQVKSAILLAGLHAPGRTRVTEPARSRDHTENMLGAMGAEVVGEQLADGTYTAGVIGEVQLHPLELEVPADPSSAAFPLVAALTVPGSRLVLERVGLNATRIGLLEALRLMGADVRIDNRRTLGGEPVGDLAVGATALRAAEIPADLAPAMIDEYPILAVAAAHAGGRTVMRGIGELRVKETDRLAVMAAGLRAAGVVVEEGEDWLAVTGGPTPAGGNVVDAQHDHRIAMSFAVLGLTTRAPITVTGAETIATSFPGFFELMRETGCRLTTS